MGLWNGGLNCVAECGPEHSQVALAPGDLCKSTGGEKCVTCFLSMAWVFLFHRTNTKIHLDYAEAATEVYWEVDSALSAIPDLWCGPVLWLCRAGIFDLFHFGHCRSITHQWNISIYGVLHSEFWTATLHLRLWVGIKKYPTSNWPWQIQFKLQRDIFPPISQNVINFPCGKLFKTDMLVNYGIRDPITTSSIKTYCAS